MPGPILSFESISVVISQKLSELDRFNIVAFFFTQHGSFERIQNYFNLMPQTVFNAVKRVLLLRESTRAYFQCSKLGRIFNLRESTITVNSPPRTPKKMWPRTVTSQNLKVAAEAAFFTKFFQKHTFTQQRTKKYGQERKLAK